MSAKKYTLLKSVVAESCKFPLIKEFNEELEASLLVHLDLLGKTVQLLEGVSELSDLDGEDVKSWKDILEVFSSIEKGFNILYAKHLEESSKRYAKLPLSKFVCTGPGRPRFNIPKELLIELRGLNFSWAKISKMFGISRWTVMRRVAEYDLGHIQKFSDITDERIEDIIKDYISRHGSTTGEPFMSGYFHSLGLHVQRSRIRSALNMVDPYNTALRWGTLVSRRKYFVKWPNSLWHIDGSLSNKMEICNPWLL